MKNLQGHNESGCSNTIKTLIRRPLFVAALDHNDTILGYGLLTHERILIVIALEIRAMALLIIISVLGSITDRTPGIDK